MIWTIVSYLLYILLGYFLVKFLIIPSEALFFYKRQGIKVNLDSLIMGAASMIKGYSKHNDVLYARKRACQNAPNQKGYITNFGSGNMLLLNDLALLKDFAFKDSFYEKAIPKFMMCFFKGGGLPFVGGETWKKHRKIISQSFHFEFLKENTSAVVSTTRSMLKNLESKSQVEILPELQQLGGEIVGKIFFGEQLNNYSLDGKPLPLKLTEINKQNMKIVMNPIYFLLGDKFVTAKILPLHKKAMEDMENFRAVCSNIVKEKKKNPNSRDLIGSLIRMQDPKDPDGFMSDDNIIDEFISFFAAGMDTTAHLTMMVLYVLIEDPQRLEKVRAEIAKIFEKTSDPGFEDYNNMDYLNGVIKETLRHYSPAPGTILRRAVQDHMIGDLKIRKGTMLFGDTVFHAFDPKYFENPYDFIPERWLKKIDMDPYAYSPFWAGPRNCIGQHLALIMVRVIVVEFVRKFKYETDKDYILKMSAANTYAPGTPIKFHLTPL